MKKLGLLLITSILAFSTFISCGQNSKDENLSQGNGDTKAASSKKEQLTMWFWGADPGCQNAMKNVLIDKYNASQDNYELKVEFRNTVDKDISVALAAGQGPDIVYGSGPSFVMPLADAGKLISLDKYSEKYGWKDRILTPLYESGTVKGSLYSVPNSISTMGIFYNKKVLKDNGWTEPKTIAELEKIMDEAMAKGLYASVTGNKGWKPVNENYASLFLTHFAGPETVYNCLTGKEKWNNPRVVEAIEKSAEWYKKGYLAGKDYVNLNFSETIQLLANEKSPFFIGPSIGFQWAAPFFTKDKAENLAFIPFPSGKDDINYPTYTLGTACTFSINTASKKQDAAAEVINTMLTPEFMQEMTAVWPGYWGTPLKDLSKVDDSNMPYMSKEYVKTIKAVSEAINNGNFGYYDNVFFPAATQQVFIDIETVWNGQNTASQLMDKADAEFSKEFEKGLVPPIPVPLNK